MRRGHARSSGWRNDNPRHFRPRNGGNPYYRPPRPIFGLLDTPRFPPPNHSNYRPHAYGGRFENIERGHEKHSGEPSYRPDPHNSYQSNSENSRYNERQKFFTKNRPEYEKPSDSYSNQRNLVQNKHDNSFLHKNSMGDVDHRQVNHNRNYRSGNIDPWNDDARPYRPRNFDPVQRNDFPESNKIPLPEYSGHRPPSSDHYGCSSSISTIEKSNSFSRSADDTVDIVRKRLQNRSESTSFDNYENRPSIEDQTFGHDQVNTSDGSQESPIKRRLQRQRQSDKVNCAKMKNKIVNQLFKMDKEKIHKLMDNPNCSSKFEFAINSLITESQNSFNRHLRSVAEKSLCSSSDDFIQSDNNTIYEDTFMKQMQCILDPQDTILLEDIKPIVMAELSSILQVDEEDNQYIQDEHMQFNEFHQSNSRSQNIPTDQMHHYDNYGNVQEDYDNNYCHENLDNVMASHSHETKHWPLFERRPQRISKHFSTDTTTSQYKMDHSFESQKGFDANTEPLSDEDDTFAELDNQYHVAVDHDFIEQEDNISEQNAVNRTSYSGFVKSEKVEKEIECKQELREEIGERSCAYLNRNDMVEEKPENLKFSFTSDVENAKVSEQKNRESNTSQSVRRTIDDFPSNKLTPDSRKRTNDQKPSHRKEKRKKSENSQTLETSKQILNKNIIINVNDCANKTSEKCDAPKSIFNLFFSKEKDTTGSKEINVTSEKSVIKKEVSKTPDAKSDKRRKKCNSMSSNQSTSPKELNNSCNISSTSKTDTKATLKTIDMFTEQPKKLSIHQAHRNTSKLDLASDIKVKKNLDRTVLTKQVSKSQATIQVSKKMSSKETQTIKPKKQTRFSQTIKKTMAFKATQTEIKVCDKPGSKTTDPLERMKEIDFEIQALIQEKFKLYSSIESKESSANSLNSLGMTVLNVGVEEEEQNEPILTEDAIVEDFVNIPDDELEKIVFNSEPHEFSTANDGRKTNTRKATSQTSQLSDVSTRTIKKPNKKLKTPNISLIEQIITDERPLEDIISLDDYELTPVKKKGKSKKPRQISRKKTVHKEKHSIDYCKKYSLKGCSVVLTRTYIQEYLKDTNMTSSLGKDENLMYNVEEPRATTDDVPTKVIEEAVVNEIQFDMLDVSEDIVIGDVCAVKADNDKEAVENVSLSINEEVILDNSQSSMEEVATTVFGQNDGCKVFDYSADENLKRDSTLISGNGDAILAIECVENNFLAASLDGHVYYFNSDGQLLSTLYGSNFAVTCLTIVKEKYGTTVYTGSLDSRIRLYDLETGRPVGTETNVLSPIQTMDRAWDTLFVGTRTGFVLQFEHKNNLLIPVSTVKFADQSILALKAMKEGPRKVLLVAARSENVTIKDAQTGLLLRTLVGPKMTVYSLLYEDGKVYCGTSSHEIHVFDYASGSHAGTHSGGKGAVCLRATGGLVFAGCYDGCVYIYREGESKPRAQLSCGTSLMLLSLAVVGTKIIAGYKDRSLYIWKIPLCILQEMIL